MVQRFLVAEGAAVVLDRGGDGDLSAGGSDLSWQTQRVDGGTIFPGNGGSRDPKVPQQVPSATLAVEHYNRLVRLLEHGQPVRMEVNIQTTFHPETNPEGNAFNIIAEIPGTDLANEVVIMGAHFDTYPYATGATDNTTGSAAMIEAVRVIQKLGLKPRRTIRLCLWAAEEQGLLGSRAYVERHYFDSKTKTPKPEQQNVQAYFNLDNGTGRILGIWGQGNTGAMKSFEQWGQALKDLGWKNVSPRSVTQTDHGSFDEAGMPGFQFIQERLEYNSRTHHSNMDTFDHVQKDDVIQQGAVAAVFAWNAANTPEKLPRKPCRRLSRRRSAGAGRERHNDTPSASFDSGISITVSQRRFRKLCAETAHCFSSPLDFRRGKPLELRLLAAGERGVQFLRRMTSSTGSVPPTDSAAELENDAVTPVASRGHADDAALIERALARAGYDVFARRVDNAEALRRELHEANGTW